MDSLVAAAGRALAAGDSLGALKLVALRGDPPALALRGIATIDGISATHASPTLTQATNVTQVDSRTGTRRSLHANVLERRDRGHFRDSSPPIS